MASLKLTNVRFEMRKHKIRVNFLERKILRTIKLGLDWSGTVFFGDASQDSIRKSNKLRSIKDKQI